MTKYTVIGGDVSHSSPQVTRSAEQFGQHIAAWRKILGLTADQVCQRADITRDTLRKIERGESVGFHIVLAVARALGNLDTLTDSIDPLKTDLGRARAHLISLKRVR